MNWAMNWEIRPTGSWAPPSGRRRNARFAFAVSWGKAPGTGPPVSEYAFAHSQSVASREASVSGSFEFCFASSLRASTRLRRSAER